MSISKEVGRGIFKAMFFEVPFEVSDDVEDVTFDLSGHEVLTNKTAFNILNLHLYTKEFKELILDKAYFGEDYHKGFLKAEINDDAQIVAYYPNKTKEIIWSLNNSF